MKTREMSIFKKVAKCIFLKVNGRQNMADKYMKIQEVYKD